MRPGTAACVCNPANVRVDIEEWLAYYAQLCDIKERTESLSAGAFFNFYSLFNFDEINTLTFSCICVG